MDEDIRFIQNILNDEMVSKGFPVVYKGKLNHELMKMFSTMAEKKISQTCKDVNVRKKVFHVMVECLQNITRHSDDFEEDGIGNGIFVVGERPKYYYVITGNMVKLLKAEKIEKKLHQLNKLNSDELSRLLKNQMEFGKINEKGGAGLGLIDMIKKTGEKYIYQFLDINDKFKFFIFKVTIPK